MSNSKHWFRSVAIAAASSWLGLVAISAQAAPIDLTAGYPDLTTFNASVNYTYVAVCQNSSGSSIGTCSGPRTIPRWDLTYGRLSVTGSTMALNPDGSGLIGVSGGSYSLTVVLGFNGTGSALSGILGTDPWSGDTLYTTSLSATGTTSNPSFQSGTIVTGTPTDATAYGYAYPFGFASGTPNSSGTFEFVFNNIGGDFAAFGSGTGGIIIAVSGLTNPGTGSWDSQGVNFWKTSHSATNATVNTFVPVPAAVWFFGSGLLSLFGTRLARKHKEV